MGEHTKPTQNQRILEYIREFGSITQLEALRDLGVMRLASRISDLRKQGWSIISKREPVKNRYEETCYIKRYSLEEYSGIVDCKDCKEMYHCEKTYLGGCTDGKVWGN